MDSRLPGAFFNLSSLLPPGTPASASSDSLQMQGQPPSTRATELIHSIPSGLLDPFLASLSSESQMFAANPSYSQEQSVSALLAADSDFFQPSPSDYVTLSQMNPSSVPAPSVPQNLGQNQSFHVMPPRIDSLPGINGFDNLGVSSTTSIPSSAVNDKRNMNESDGSDMDDCEDQRNANGKTVLSRHVTSVISHFTSSNDGFKRLLNEIDDFLHVINISGSIMYTSPSIKRLLGYEPDELVDSSILDIVHVEDRQALDSKLSSCVQSQSEFHLYCRYKKKGSGYLLMEIKAKPVVDEAMGTVKHIVQSARDYKSKASIAIDSILELRIESLRLRRQLEKVLLEKGMDPRNHPLLMESNDISQIPEDLNLNAEQGLPLPSSSNLLANGLSLPTSSAPGYHQNSPAAINAANPLLDNRKRKGKIPTEELFCRQCGTTQSPEWRKGPEGPKTLCNACGLAYAKKQRKMNKKQ